MTQIPVPAEIGESIWQLNDPSELVEISRIASEASRHVSAADSLWDLIELAAKEAKAAQNDTRVAGLWRLVDRVCKESEPLKEAFRPRLLTFAETFAIAPESSQYTLFAQLLEGFKPVFGTAQMTIVGVKLRALQKLSSAPTIGFDDNNSSVRNTPGQGQVTVSARTIAGLHLATSQQLTARRRQARPGREDP